MLSDGTNVTIREGEVEETTCNCCGAPTTVVTGHLDVGDLSAGWYTVGVTLGKADHLPLVNLYIGDWTESAGPDERWGLRVGISGDGPSLLNWPEADAAKASPVFTPLGRDQVLGTPMESQVFTLIDRILTRDSRL